MPKYYALTLLEAANQPVDNMCELFDSLSKLAQSHPATFEEIRQHLIAAEINQAHPDTRERLRGLQTSVDLEIQAAQSPFQAMVRLSKRMLNHVYGRNGLLEEANAILTPKEESLPSSSDNIVPFSPLTQFKKKR